MTDGSPDGPDGSERSGDGYRVAARIESRPSNRGRLLAILAAVVVVVWVAAVVNGRLAPPPSPSQLAIASLRAQPSDVLGETPRPSFPPDVELVQPTTPLGRLPVFLDGLAFFDLRTGAVDRSLGLDLAQWPFALADGAACVCLEGAHGLTQGSLHLYRWGRTGVLGSAWSIGGWLPSDQGITLVDAALTPDGAFAIVASVVQDGADWDLRVQRIPLSSEGPIAEGDLRAIDLASLGDPARLQLRVFVAPDGHRVRVTLQQLADDLAAVPGTEHSWIVALDQRGFGPLVDAPALPPAAQPASCAAEAWLTADVFAQLCQSPDADGQGRVAAFARLLGPGDGFRDIGIGLVDQFEPIGWLVDGSRGEVYAWSAIGHQITRLSVSGEVHFRGFALGDAVDAAPLQAVAPDGPQPPPRPRPAIWQPVGRASQPQASPIVGSADGSLIYAAGYALGGEVGNGSLTSTGIWVFDADSLALVGHWPAVAGYQVLGLETGGRYLVAMGTPSPSEVAAFGNHGPELAVHDVTDGSVVAIQRELILRLGGMPFFLPAGPPG